MLRAFYHGEATFFKALIDFDLNQLHQKNVQTLPRNDAPQMLSLSKHLQVFNQFLKNKMQCDLFVRLRFSHYQYKK